MTANIAHSSIATTLAPASRPSAKYAQLLFVCLSGSCLRNVAATLSADGTGGAR
jgi:hypothetical protein